MPNSRNGDSGDGRRRPLLTVAEVAAALSTSERHVRRLVASRLLCSVKCGGKVRVLPEDLDEFIASGRRERPR